MRRGLTKMVLLRGDVLDPKLQKEYATKLHKLFPPNPEVNSDIAAVLELLAITPRAEFESRVPELGTLVGLIRRETMERRRRVRLEGDRRKAEMEERRRKEHPEEYCGLREIFKDWAASDAERCSKVVAP